MTLVTMRTMESYRVQIRYRTLVMIEAPTHRARMTAMAIMLGDTAEKVHAYIIHEKESPTTRLYNFFIN